MSAAGRAEPSTGEDYFNRAHPLHWLKARFAMRARARMYRRVLAFARPDRETRIVDGGTGEDVTLLGACALLLTRELGLTVHR